MLRALILTIAMASTFDCQPAEPGPPGPQGAPGPMGTMGTPGMLNPSGTRIVARYVTTEDGARQFLGWYDSQRKEECSFRIFNGTMRCMPTALLFQGGPGFFVDAACTIRGAAVEGASCPKTTPAAYRHYVTDSNQCTGERIARLMDMGDKAIYRKSGAQCQKDQDIAALRMADIDERDFAQGSTQ